MHVCMMEGSSTSHKTLSSSIDSGGGGFVWERNMEC